MSSDIAFPLPRKKRSILWLIGGAFLLLLGVFFLQLYGPSPPIIASRETTLITTPISTNGLPDFATHMLELGREGVTPENNSAVLFWYAMGLEEVDSKHRQLIADVLRLEAPRLLDGALVSVDDRSIHESISVWLAADRRGSKLPTDSAGITDDELGDNEVGSDAAIDLSVDVTTHAWTSAQVPPLAEWIEENNRFIDLLVEASGRPRYYSPSPTLLERNVEQGSLMAMLLPAIQQLRSASRSLMARAMWHLGEGRVEKAWQDLLAVHRFSRLFQQDPTLVAKYLAISNSSIALWATATLLHEGGLTLDQARQVQRDLAALPAFSSIGDSIDGAERLAMLDMICGASTNPDNLNILIAAQFGEESRFTAIPQFAINWNQALLDTNHWYDRLVSAFRHRTYTARRQAFDSIKSQHSDLEDKLENTSQWGPILLSRTFRGRFVADLLAGFAVESLLQASQTQDRANTMLELTRLAAALAVYRADHGVYPESLVDLTPGILHELPRDLYNAQPFRFRRIDKGYLVYSLGPNGSDDEGSSIEMDAFQGTDLLYEETPIAEEQRKSILQGADDISIRVPRALLKLSHMPSLVE